MDSPGQGEEPQRACEEPGSQRSGELALREDLSSEWGHPTGG